MEAPAIYIHNFLGGLDYGYNLQTWKYPGRKQIYLLPCALCALQLELFRATKEVA